MDSGEDELIKVFVSKGIPYIWNVKDWYKLRVEHHIVGKFDGVVPPWDFPNRFPNLSYLEMNLPLRLSKEETLYLVKHGIAKSYEVPEMNEAKPPVNVERYKNALIERQKEQVERYKLKRKAFIESKYDEIIEGKKRKGREAPDKETMINDALSKIKNMPCLLTSVQLKDPWVPEDQKCIPFTFPEPRTTLEKVRSRVFDDFTFNRKYYITSGTKFGGDFLAYPGDPMHHHAQYIIICEDHNQKVHTTHVIAHARLASIVKKTLLIAYIDTTVDVLKYKPVSVPYLEIDSNTTAAPGEVEMQGG